VARTVQGNARMSIVGGGEVEIIGSARWAVSRSAVDGCAATAKKSASQFTRPQSCRT
jgi:hypothetical protein